MAAELFPGFELMERKAPLRLWHYLTMTLQSLLTMQMPARPAPVTFVLRDRTSGETRRVTARSVEEAQLRVAQGKFD